MTKKSDQGAIVMMDFKAIEDYISYNGKGMIVVGFFICVLLLIISVFIVHLLPLVVIGFIALAVFAFIVAIYRI
mgnify:CR=1 FL=1